MDPFANELNTMFISTYRSINKVEETMLKNLSGGSLSIGEMHIIERIGRDAPNGVNVSDIAQEMGIALPSATIAIKKLEKKGYVTKTRDTEDARRVYVTLTEQGRRAEIAHRYFHRQMLKAVVKAVHEDERPALLNAVRALNEFFDKAARDAEAGGCQEGKKN